MFNDPVARVAVSRTGTARDCTCPVTLAICNAAVCPRRAVIPASVSGRGPAVPQASDALIAEMVA